MPSPKPLRHGWRTPSVIPGLPLTLGVTLTWLTLIVLIPLATLFLKSAGMGWERFISVGFSERALAAYRLSFGTAAAAGLVNAIFGLLVAWALVRYAFPGKRLISAMVDLPFALPTAVAGIALTALYAPNGWIGRYLEPLGIKVAFTAIGITVALPSVRGLPGSVRTWSVRAWHRSPLAWSWDVQTQTSSKGRLMSRQGFAREHSRRFARLHRPRRSGSAGFHDRLTQE